jgi:hypothetical protein
MKTCYIAAPFAGTPDDSRALALARLAMDLGFAPVVIHPAVRAGAYGDDNDPDARERGLEAAKTIAAQCDELWCLLRDDGTASGGCQAEIIHRKMTTGKAARSATWNDWQAVARVLAPGGLLAPHPWEFAPVNEPEPYAHAYPSDLLRPPAEIPF